MLSNLADRWKSLESRLAVEWGSDISTPDARRKALLHFHILDHGMLRALWFNLSEISPDVWRCNQPSKRGVQRLKDLGIKTILNLRGANQRSPYLFEKEACEELGLDLVSCQISARSLAPRQNILELLDAFESIERPFVMHCKSGADRAGLAAAFYLLHIKGATCARAKKQLSFRHLHISASATGILDHVLDAYEQKNAQSPIPLREWIETCYDPLELTAEFNQARSKS